MPILALRGLAVFPDQTVHFDVGRPKSIRALETAMKQDQTLLLIPQKDMQVDDPKLIDLYPIGTVAKVKIATRDELCSVKGITLANAMAIEQYYSDKKT